MLTEVFKMQAWNFVAFVNFVLIAGGAGTTQLLEDLKKSYNLAFTLILADPVQRVFLGLTRNQE